MDGSCVRLRAEGMKLYLRLLGTLSVLENPLTALV